MTHLRHFFFRVSGVAVHRGQTLRFADRYYKVIAPTLMQAFDKLKLRHPDRKIGALNFDAEERYPKEEFVEIHG